MDQLRNAELVDNVVFLIERELKHQNCLQIVEAISSNGFCDYEEIFKEQVGMSVAEYIDTARMNEAEKLLEQSELDIKDIAKAVGVNGYFEFTQLFKKINGMTASSFRNQLNQT